MNLHKRSYQKELLDNDEIPKTDIVQNMHELDVINTFTGGHAITIKGFKQLIKEKSNIHVCEIGCGGGDNLIALSKWCRKNNIEAHFIGIDIKKDCIETASSKKILQNNARWITSDYSLVNFDEKPDIIFSSLFCHHFTDEELVKQLQWMKTNSLTGFFINDLHRSAISYYTTKFFAPVLSKSYLVKNDAPLSIARSFLKSEWQNLLQKAGIEDYVISWQWAFRYLIIYKHAA